MWLLHFVPDTYLQYAIFTVLASGVLLIFAGYILKILPALRLYSTPTIVGGVLITCVSMYLIGGYGVENEWRQKALELENKVKEAEVKSQKVNTEVVTKVVNQKVYIKEKGQEITKYVDREVVKYDTKFLPGGICEIPQEFIKAHDGAAKGKGIEDKVVDNNTLIPTDEINKAARGQK